MTDPTPVFPPEWRTAPVTAEGNHTVALRPNPAVVAGAVMGTLLAGAAYVALSGTAPVGAHITQVRPLNEVNQSSTAGSTDPAASLDAGQSDHQESAGPE